MQPSSIEANGEPWIVILVRYISTHLHTRQKIALLIVVGIVAALMLFGFIGDDLKAADLRTIETNLNSHTVALPSTLKELDGLHLHYSVQHYNYHPIGGLYTTGHGPSYTLCTKFILPGFGSGFSKHGRGKQCYQINYYLNHGSADILPMRRE